MGSAAARLADSPSIERWPGAITVFAAPDIFLRASCPGCSRRHLLLEHMALGYFPYSDLAGVLRLRIPSASIGLCLNMTAARTPFTVRLYVDGVEVSHPDLYNDGRYVVHGIEGVIAPLPGNSCVEGPWDRVRTAQFNTILSEPPVIIFQIRVNTCLPESVHYSISRDTNNRHVIRLK